MFLGADSVGYVSLESYACAVDDSDDPGRNSAPPATPASIRPSRWCNSKSRLAVQADVDEAVAADTERPDKVRPPTPPPPAAESCANCLMVLGDSGLPCSSKALWCKLA